MNDVVSRETTDGAAVHNFLRRGVVGDFYARADREAQDAVSLLDDATRMHEHVGELSAAADRFHGAALRTLRFVPAAIARNLLEASDRDLGNMFCHASAFSFPLHLDPRLALDAGFRAHMQDYLARVLRDFFVFQGRMVEERDCGTHGTAHGQGDVDRRNWVSYRFVDPSEDESTDPAALAEARRGFFDHTDAMHRTFLHEMHHFDPEGAFARLDWLSREHVLFTTHHDERNNALFASMKVRPSFPPDSQQPLFRKRFHISGFRRVNFDGDASRDG